MSALLDVSHAADGVSRDEARVAAKANAVTLGAIIARHGASHLRMAYCDGGQPSRELDYVHTTWLTDDRKSLIVAPDDIDRVVIQAFKETGDAYLRDTFIITTKEVSFSEACEVLVQQLIELTEKERGWADNWIRAEGSINLAADGSMDMHHVEILEEIKSFEHGLW